MLRSVNDTSAMAAPAVSASHSLAASAVPVAASWLYPLYAALRAIERGKNR
jgi:hypothetical protein